MHQHALACIGLGRGMWVRRELRLGGAFRATRECVAFLRCRVTSICLLVWGG